MTKNQKNLLIWLPIFFAIGLLLTGPWFYIAEPIEGWVVDAETKKPVQGVIVTANWELEFGTPGGNVPVGQVKVLETVTDKNGRYIFPGWGPRFAWKGHLTTDAPQLLLFKPGYKSAGKENSFSSAYPDKMARTSEWNRKTIELTKFKGSLEEYYKTDLQFLGTSAGSIIRDNCGWKRIPRMVTALGKQKRLLTQKRILNSLYSIDQLSSKKCGSAREFLEANS